MRQDSIPELPAESHPYFLLPKRTLTIKPSLAAEPIELSYRESGTGRPVLLLHGLWTGAYTFRHLIPLLQDRFRLVMPQLTDPAILRVLPNGDYRPRKLAPLFEELTRRLNLEGCLVVAHAESGLASLHWGLTRPAGMGALITVGTAVGLSALTRLRGWWMTRPRSIERLAKKGFKQPSRAAFSMLDYIDPAVVSRQEIRQLARSWSNLPGARATANILAQTLTTNYRRDLLQTLIERSQNGTSFPVPLKVVVGKSDRLASPEQGQKLNRLFPGSELLVADHSAGTVQVERPQWLAEVIASAAV